MTTLSAMAILGGLVVGTATVPATVKTVQKDGHPVFVLENYRVRLTIDPTRGGAITAYEDKLAPAQLVLQRKYQGLCMDHVQSQNWPGELLESPYQGKIVSAKPEAVAVQVTHTLTGRWRTEVVDPKVVDLHLEKTYTLRADSPAVECQVTLTSPKGKSKVFAYWQQHVFFAGGDYDLGTDRTFRPSDRGVRSNAAEGNTMWGNEEWMRDFSDGWIALVDTTKKTGVATLTDYHELSINYANGGNRTNEVMFNTAYLPGGESKTYHTLVIPVAGMDRVVHVSAHMVFGHRVTSDNKGNGRIQWWAVRSGRPVKDVDVKVRVAGAAPADSAKVVEAGTFKTGPLADQPKRGTLVFSGAAPDPLVVRYEVRCAPLAGGKTVTERFEDYHNGAYKWGDNIQTDMRSPLYRAPRRAQRLVLRKPAKLRLKDNYGAQYLYFEGLLDEAYGLGPAAHFSHWRAESKRIFYEWGGSFLGKLSDFPYDYDELLGYDVVILGGVHASGLKPIGVEMLADFLAAGGGMLVLGSHGAYAKSALAGTKLARAWPVAIKPGRFDIQPVPGLPVRLGKDRAEFLRHVDLSDAPRSYWLHEVTVKPGARVVLEAGGRPMLVVGEFGPNKARVACLLAAPMGDPPAGQTPFWRSRGWPYVLRNLLWWLARDDRHFPTDGR